MVREAQSKRAQERELQGGGNGPREGSYRAGAMAQERELQGGAIGPREGATGRGHWPKRWSCRLVVEG